MTTNTNAREYLDYYLSLSSDPEFAVLLEGPWGSGKTHFVETYFADRLTAARRANPDAKDPLIHVTLFGVRDLSDITTQMFERAHPLLGGKAVKFLNNFGSKLAGLARLKLDPKENEQLIQSMVLNLKDKVIVFDDLERSPIPLVEVMGFINGFVERDKLRVIVVASEADIDEKQKEEYKRRKEKLVGKTIKVGSDPGQVLDVFSRRLQTPEVLKAIADNREQLLATFSASGRPNFRSLRAALLDFDRIVSLVDPRLKASDEAMAQLLLSMVALGVEFRSNALDDHALRNLQIDMRRRLNLGSSAKADAAVESKASSLRDRYEHVAFDDPIILPAHLADLFTSGTVNVDAVNQHIARHPKVVGPAEVPAWRFMWSWHDYPASIYHDARARFLDDLTHRKMTHPGQILHAAGSAIRLKKYGDDLLGGRTAKAYFTDYLADIENAGTLEPAPEIFDHFGRSYAGLVYNEHDTSTFAPVKQLVEAASQRSMERKLKADAPELLKRLQSNSHDASVLFEWGLEKGNYGGFAILHYISISDFADLALVDGKPNDAVLGALSERHKRRTDAALAPEVPWLENLRRELTLRVGKLAPPYKAFAKAQLDYLFTDIDKVVVAYRAVVKPTRSRQAGNPGTAATRKPGKRAPSGGSSKTA